MSSFQTVLHVCLHTEYALDRKIRELEELSTAVGRGPGGAGDNATTIRPEESGEKQDTAVYSGAIGKTFFSGSSVGGRSSGGGGCSQGGEDHNASMYRVSEFIDDMDSDDEALTVQIEYSDFQEAVRNTKLSLSAEDYKNYKT